MQIAIQRPFERVSFSRQFLVAGGLVFAAGTVAIGAWLGRQIEQTAVNRAALIASVYVESILAAELHGWSRMDSLSGPTHTTLDRIFVDGPLARKVVRFKVWNRAGTILYSSDHEQDGDTHPVAGRLAEAFRGRMQAHVSDLDGPEHASERARWTRLLEVYVPVRTGPAGGIGAVVEFYHSMENLDREIRDAQHQSWLLVILSGGAISALLYGLVRRASNTIVDQQRDLREQLTRLRATLRENLDMRVRLEEAGAQMTAMNEQALRRTAADLHDGPAQHLAFALLRFDDMVRDCGGCRQGNAGSELGRIQGALAESLDELRAIAGGLGVPGIDRLDLADTLRRAAREVERKFPSGIDADLPDTLGDASLAVKITVYRLAHEALTNALRHAPGKPPRLAARRVQDILQVEVSDEGPGFDPQAAGADRLGIAFMRERVRLVGGRFDLVSAAGRGTVVRAEIPLAGEGSPADA